jgi:hypothetical protein
VISAVDVQTPPLPIPVWTPSSLLPRNVEPTVCCQDVRKGDSSITSWLVCVAKSRVFPQGT